MTSLKGLAANIRLGWERLTLTNILACCDMELITAVECFILHSQIQKFQVRLEDKWILQGPGTNIIRLHFV
jgi:hypothetical protein